MSFDRITKQIVITMTVDQNTDSVNHGLLQLNKKTVETKLEVNDLGASEVPEELFKKDELTSGKIEQEIYDLLKPYFENMTGIPIIEEGQKNDKKI